MELHRDNLAALIAACRGDGEALEMIERALLSIESYHSAIYEMETRKVILSASEPDAEVYRSEIAALDRLRTAKHNALLVNIRTLNRIAAAEGLDPVCDGTVSEEKPFRREVADAALAYAQTVIENRP